MKKTLMLLVLATLAVVAVAQVRTIQRGTTIFVRTYGPIYVSRNDGRVFEGAVDEDVLDQDGRVAIPGGSRAELTVRNFGDRELVLDMESVTVRGERYAVATSEERAGVSGRREGVGRNERTGEFVGSGAVIGAIIGAIAGGGKGAAIGAGAGAAAGAGAQLATRGRTVVVPAESLLTFRLERRLDIVMDDPGYYRHGFHYHPYR